MRQATYSALQEGLWVVGSLLDYFFGNGEKRERRSFG